MENIDLDALRVVEINGRTYLGIVTQTMRDESGQDDSVIISDHVAGSISNTTLKTYVKDHNLGKLNETTFNGPGINFSSRLLDDDETKQFKVYIEAMKQIKADAMAMLENQYFDGAF